MKLKLLLKKKINLYLIIQHILNKKKNKIMKMQQILNLNHNLKLLKTASNLKIENYENLLLIKYFLNIFIFNVFFKIIKTIIKLIYKYYYKINLY